MTKEKQEHLILQIKYAFLALIIGICVGIVDTVFGRGLLAISHRLLSIPASISSTDGTSDHLVISAFQ